jgi:ribosomal protein L37AE/L43A
MAKSRRCARALSKVRGDEQGHAYVERDLVRSGARPRLPGELGADWLRDALPAAGVRSLLHGGNHRYAFRLGGEAATRGGRVAGGGLSEGSGGMTEAHASSHGEQRGSTRCGYCNRRLVREPAGDWACPRCRPLLARIGGGKDRDRDWALVVQDFRDFQQAAWRDRERATDDVEPRGIHVEAPPLFEESA